MGGEKSGTKEKNKIFSDYTEVVQSKCTRVVWVV